MAEAMSSKHARRMHQQTHFTHSPNRVWSTFDHESSPPRRKQQTSVHPFLKKQYTPTHQHSGMFITLHHRETREAHAHTHIYTSFTAIKVNFKVFHMKSFNQCTFVWRLDLPTAFPYLFFPPPFIQPLTSISIFRRYCAAGLRWVECSCMCICVCMSSQKFPTAAVNQLPSGCLTEQRSVQVCRV